MQQNNPMNNVIDFPITKCPPARARQYDEDDGELIVVLIADHEETRDIIKQALGYGN